MSLAKKLSELIFFRLMGWKIEGQLPHHIKKYIIVVASHTSNWDFPLGVFVRTIEGVKSRFVAKQELFVFPFGYFFRWMGGYAVNRKVHSNFIDAVVDVFSKEADFVIAITPEGTRGYSPKWKKGFYHIAQRAEVPVIAAALDYPNKRVVISEPFEMKLSADEEVEKLKVFFRQYKGRYPEKGVQ
jgi:1-acyl-sn-glycerol-3-phosphate acyltransferase